MWLVLMPHLSARVVFPLLLSLSSVCVDGPIQLTVVLSLLFCLV